MATDRQLLQLILHRQSTQTRLILMGLKGEWELHMNIADVLAQENAGLTTLEANDKAVLAKLVEIQQNGGTLSDAQAAQATDILKRIAVLSDGDEAALNTAPTGTGDGSGATADPAPVTVGDGDGGSTGDDTGATSDPTAPADGNTSGAQGGDVTGDAPAPNAGSSF